VLGAGREDHVVSRHERARRELGVEEIQARHVEVLPQIDEHEVEGAGQEAQGGERVAHVELDVRVEPRAPELAARVLHLGLRELEAVHPAAGGARGVGQPQGGVAVGGAQLDDDLGARGGDDQVEQLRGVGTDGDQELVDARGDLRLGQALHHLPLPLGAALVLGEDGLQRRIHHLSRRAAGRRPKNVGMSDPTPASSGRWRRG
jgi:hypothetical protein